MCCCCQSWWWWSSVDPAWKEIYYATARFAAWYLNNRRMQDHKIIFFVKFLEQNKKPKSKINVKNDFNEKIIIWL